MANWSDKLEQAYRFTLPPDVRAWMDDELWREPIGAEFNRPLQPERLLSPGPDEIWAGFMQPDTLPLVGNDYGDWLCLRVDRDGHVHEIVQWSHAGGDWSPWGGSLREALLFDAAMRLVRDRRPEFTDPEPPTEQVFAAAQWAVACSSNGMPALSIGRFWEHGPRDKLEAAALLESLAAADVAPVAARRELLLVQLNSELKQRAGPDTAEEMDLQWEPDFVRWLFDNQLASEQTRQQLARQWGLPAEALMGQDWQEAERIAMRVAEMRTDLAWALDIAGWAAERRGDFAAAVPRYLNGLNASVFADDSIRFRTQWFPAGYGKFSAYRLHELIDQLPGAARQDPYLQLFWQDEPDTLRERVASHWTQLAEQQRSQGRFWEACQCRYRAGWDVGLSVLDQYEQLLEEIAHDARAAGSTALANIAETHRRMFS